MAYNMVKSACEPLQKAVMTALKTFSATSKINIYDHIPAETETYPYIALRDMTEVSWGSKTEYGATISFPIEIYKQDRSSLPMKNICSEIISTLNTAFPYHSLIDDYEIVYHSIMSNTITQMDKNVYMGVINCSFFMEELKENLINEA